MPTRKKFHPTAAPSRLHPGGNHRVAQSRVTGFSACLALGAFAGLQAAETERIEWRDIDLAGGFIHVASDKAKTRSRRLVPIVPNLAAWLAPYAKHTGQVWKGTPNDLRDARAETVKAAGVAWKDNGSRHSFISYRLADVQNAAQVALEAGNSPNGFRHYRELVKPADAKAWFTIMYESRTDKPTADCTNMKTTVSALEKTWWWRKSNRIWTFDPQTTMTKAVNRYDYYEM